MSKSHVISGYVDIDQTKLYYESAGSGIPLLLIHAGVADCEQWENEFFGFSDNFQVIRYDLRGYGKSDPVDGPFSHLEDLKGVIEGLTHDSSMILMGCCVGGVLAMDYALEYSQNIRGLIMIGPGSCGLEVENNKQELFVEAMKAFEAGDLNRLAEIKTEIWFDSMDSAPDKVDESMRALIYDMCHSGLSSHDQQSEQEEAGTSQPEIKQFNQIDFPVLVIVGSDDLPYMHEAADYLNESIPSSRKEVIANAAHLPNLDQPQLFQEVVGNFLDEITSGQDYDHMLP